MRNYLVILNKPSYIKDFCIYTGEVSVITNYKTTAIICGRSEDHVVHKIGKLYGHDISIFSIKLVEL